jgi:hypothetical protein
MYVNILDRHHDYLVYNNTIMINHLVNIIIMLPSQRAVIQIDTYNMKGLKGQIMTFQESRKTNNVENWT